MRRERAVGQEVVGRYGHATIGPAHTDDLPEILALFDASIAWLNGRGITGQWGTSPFSQLPHVVRQFRASAEAGEFHVARIDGDIVGTVALRRTAPLYTLPALPDFPATARYLEGLTTARSQAGLGLGRDLVAWAEAHGRADGATVVWLDCWADSVALCRYYERAGYVGRGEFWIGRWRGRLFEKRLVS
ncbi:MAG: GNAT family N-acetyltransferase [Acidimicrobiales bacterium]